MTTKTITTPTGNTIKIEMVRKVQDKVSYADGYNIVTGREIIEYTRITLRDKNGKYLTDGNKVEMLNPRFYKNHDQLVKQGAVARIGDAYLSQYTLDLINGLLAEVEAETPKSEEQIEIETRQAKAKAAHEAWENSPEEIAYRAFVRKMEDPNSDY